MIILTGHYTRAALSPTLLTGRSSLDPSMASRRGCLKWSHAEHCKRQWHTSSTSPLSHSLHTLSYLFIPCPSTIFVWKATLPPLNFTIILLSAFHFNTAQFDSTSHSPIIFIMDNFGFSCACFLDLSFTFLQAFTESVFCLVEHGP